MRRSVALPLSASRLTIARAFQYEYKAFIDRLLGELARRVDGFEHAVLQGVELPASLMDEKYELGEEQSDGQAAEEQAGGQPLAAAAAAQPEAQQQDVDPPEVDAGAETEPEAEAEEERPAKRQRKRAPARPVPVVRQLRSDGKRKLRSTK